MASFLAGSFFGSEGALAARFEYLDIFDAIVRQKLLFFFVNFKFNRPKKNSASN
jgi:hypothetical protein